MNRIDNNDDRWMKLLELVFCGPTADIIGTAFLGFFVFSLIYFVLREVLSR